MGVPLRLTENVTQAINALDEAWLSSLRSFLTRLTENPFEAGLVKSCQIDESERFAYRSRGEYILYWRLSAPRRDGMARLDLQGWRVELLELKHLH